MASRSAAGSSQGPRVLVLEKVRKILDAFSDRQPNLTLQQIRGATSLPMTTCLRLVRSLCDAGVLERRGDEYRIGVTVIRWAAAAAQGSDLIQAAQPLLDELRDKTLETAVLHVPTDGMRVLVAAAQSREPVAWRAELGLLTSLTQGAGGKALVAFMPDRPDLQKLLTSDPDQIRQQGYATSENEAGRGAAGLSAPVFDRSGIVVASIGVTMPMQRMPQDVTELAKSVLLYSRSVSSRLGAVPAIDGSGSARRSS
jgi:IclR family transcriptional regulator, acetate operon repressor